MTTFDETPCDLGEGPLLASPNAASSSGSMSSATAFLTREGDKTRAWSFDRIVSAAGWVDRDRLLIASETDLFVFDLQTGTSESLVPLEADNPGSRSNDGRADPWGGFWIGTMGRRAEAKVGGVYHYRAGVLNKIISDISIPNSICFSPDGRTAYFTDAGCHLIRKCATDPETGMPIGEVDRFLFSPSRAWAAATARWSTPRALSGTPAGTAAP